jgi:hypothetical protein
MTGEIELTADDVTGIALHIAARVGAKAPVSETVVSSTVRDLVAPVMVCASRIAVLMRTRGCPTKYTFTGRLLLPEQRIDALRL